MANGKAGAPQGNNNAAKGRKFASVIEKRLAERKLLENVADALIDKALDGDVSALKELADRLDGKAKQTQDINLSTPSVKLDFKD
jgi:hypothetical protein